MNRAVFFAKARALLFSGSLTTDQVAGMGDMLDAWHDSGATDIRWLAYIFAGVFHECGKRMVPVREGFAKTDAGARAAVASLFTRGKISRNYAAPNAAGVSFYGRGRIQNTHEANYKKLQLRFGLPFTTNPDLLLDSKVDAKVTIVGHIEGIWTGHKLADFITSADPDYRNARRIVNGTDRAEDIASYARKFEAALRAADAGQAAPPAPVPAPPAIVEPAQLPPATEAPKPAQAEDDSDLYWDTPEQPPVGLWAWLKSLFWR